MSLFNPIELLLAKREGRTLAPESIRLLIEAYTAGTVPDYQMSAFLMAAFLRGLDDNETLALTEAMLYSGQVLDLSDLPGIKVDKHSTGGVGDKISLVLAPTVAACGVPVPMISGRGLGHTGGTLDKLESIPGLRVDLPIPQYRALIERLGLAMIGQTAEIAPADRKLYALRDVTATVEYIPFIAASIMSKKLAEGIDALVLDVKCGRGAFMQQEADARRLAETLVGIGERFGKRTVAWMTSMDAPIGRAIGNWPEVVESVRCLRGEYVPGLLELTVTLAAEMLFLGGAAATTEDGRDMASQAIASGRAFERFLALVDAQGGDPRVLETPERRPDVPAPVEVPAPAGAGRYVASVDPRVLGRITVEMGAGRLKKEDPVDPTAGIVLNKTVGDTVEPGEPLAFLYTKRTEELPRFAHALQQAYTFADYHPSAGGLLLDRYSASGWANL